MKKRIASLTLTAILFILAGCSGGSSSASNNEPVAAEENPNFSENLTSTANEQATAIENPNDTSLEPESTDDTSLSEQSSTADIINSLKNATLQYPSSNDEYEYNLYDSYVEITKYKGNETDVVVPEKIDNLPVKVIGERAFSDKNQSDDKLNVFKIKSITLPEGVLLIKEWAFAGFSDNTMTVLHSELTDVKLPSTLIQIDYMAFSYTVNLKKLTLPENLRKIGGAVFYKSAVEEITVPKSVETVSDGCFTEAASLKTVIIEDGVKSIGSKAFNFCPALEAVKIYSRDAELGTELFNNEAMMADGKDPTIYGYSGSTAAKYAADNKEKFKLLT